MKTVLSKRRLNVSLQTLCKSRKAGDMPAFLLYVQGIDIYFFLCYNIGNEFIFPKHPNMPMKGKEVY